MTTSIAVRVTGVLLLAAAATSGCTWGAAHSHEPTNVDTLRAQALLDDPWLGAPGVTMTEYANGTDDRYHPTTATVRRPLSGTPAEALLAEVTEAGRAGWWPFYAQCDRVPEGLPDLNGGLGVVLARELPDGALAQATLRVESDTVVIVATAPNHDVVQPEAPEESDVTAVACLSPEGVGPERTGTPVNLTRDWSNGSPRQ